MPPQDPEGSELLAGIQYRTNERDRVGWDALSNDKEQLLGMMKQRYDKWNPMVQSAMDAVPLEALSIWAFYSVPQLGTWRSRTGRVVILGDAVHTIPPAASQWINQGFEYVHCLTLLMAEVNEGKAKWRPSLKWWQQYRQARVERVTGLMNEMSRRVLPS